MVIRLASGLGTDRFATIRSAKLDGSILGMNTKVGTKAELIRCVTQAGYEVEDGGKLLPVI